MRTSCQSFVKTRKKPCMKEEEEPLEEDEEDKDTIQKQHEFVYYNRVLGNYCSIKKKDGLPSSSSAGVAENMAQPTRGLPSSSARDVAGAIAEAWEGAKEDPEGCINYGTHLCRVDLEQI